MTKSTAQHCSSPMTQALLPLPSLAAVVSWSLSWVTAKHCVMTKAGRLVGLAGSYAFIVLASQKTFTKKGNFRSSAPSTACQCSHSVSYLAKNLLSELWLGTRSLLRTTWDSVLRTGSKFITQTRRIPARNFRCNTSI